MQSNKNRTTVYNNGTTKCSSMISEADEMGNKRSDDVAMTRCPRTTMCRYGSIYCSEDQKLSVFVLFLSRLTEVFAVHLLSIAESNTTHISFMF